MIDNIFYVYILIDPRFFGPFKYGDFNFELEPFYVGKGNTNRWKFHFISGNLEKDLNKYKNNKIKKLLKLGYTKEDMILVFKYNLSEKAAFDLEKELIFTIGRSGLKNGPLTNLTDGGEGLHNPSPETRSKIGNSHKGKFVSEETKKKLSESHLGKIRGPISLEHKRQISISNTGRIPSQEEIRKRREKVFGNKYGPRSEQVKKAISQKNLGSKRNEEQIEKIRKSHQGEEYLKKFRSSRKRKNPLLICSPDGIFYEVFNLAEFCEIYNLQKHNFVNTLRKGRNLWHNWFVEVIK